MDIVGKRSTVITATVAKCGSELAPLSVVFLLVMFGNSISFYLAFGQSLSEYNTVASSLWTLIRMALGDFDFPGLYGANLFLGPFMFLTYVFAVTMLLLNMFLAVVMAVYEDVKASLEKQP